MGKTFRTGVCVLAICAVTTDAMAARVSSCADPTEVSALQTAAIQQELMDSALGCGHAWVEKFNAFQTTYGPELRRSDRVLLTLFKRIYGPSRGDANYNLFKTNMASKAEIKRVHNVTDFCSSADLVFAAALGPSKPSLSDFVGGVEVRDTADSGIGRCDIQVALTLKGAKAGPDIMPTPNPLRVAAVEPALPTPASLTMGPPPAPTPAAEPTAQATQAQAAPEKKDEKKKKGFLSGLFGN